MTDTSKPDGAALYPHAVFQLEVTTMQAHFDSETGEHENTGFAKWRFGGSSVLQ